MQPYEVVIQYVAEGEFMAEKPEGSQTVTLIAFIYNKDELRVCHDIHAYLKKRG